MALSVERLQRAETVVARMMQVCFEVSGHTEILNTHDSSLHTRHVGLIRYKESVGLIWCVSGLETREGCSELLQMGSLE